MKTGIFKTLAIAGVAACAFAQPAAALSIDMSKSGNELTISASGLAGEIIAAWDFDIVYGALTLDTVFTDGQLGVSNTETVFDWIDSPGLLDVFEVSFLSDADLLTLQAGADPIKLVTIRFNENVENEDFRFVWDHFNDVKCALNRVCFPDRQVPEPGTLAMLGLGLFGLGLGRRRLSR